MRVADIDRLREDRDEAQIALEEGCRNTFLPGMKVRYPRGGNMVTVEVIGPDEEDDYLCWVRSTKTSSEYRIKYEDITEIV